MIVELRLRLRHHGCYSETLPPGVQVTHLGGDAEHCVCTVRGAPETDLDAVLAAMRAWLDAPPQIVARTPRTVVVRCACPTRGLTATFHRLGATVLWPVVHAAGWEAWHLLAPDAAVARRVLDALEGLGEADVEQIGHPTPDELGVTLPLGELTREISARQLAALQLAIERGYYRNPREVTLARLAEELGLSRSTFQEHLQKAEQRVMDRFGRLLVRHPALAAAALRGAGRPRKADGKAEGNVRPRPAQSS